MMRLNFTASCCCPGYWERAIDSNVILISKGYMELITSFIEDRVALISAILFGAGLYVLITMILDRSLITDIKDVLFPNHI